MEKLTRPMVALVTVLSMSLLSDTASCCADELIEPSPFSQMISTLNPANWRMPKLPTLGSLLPQTDEKTRIKKKKDGLVNEVGKTASSGWARTKEAFNPQKLNPANFFSASSKNPATPSPAAEKPGFFRSMFSPSPAAQDNGTVSDFLKQSRPIP